MMKEKFNFPVFDVVSYEEEDVVVCSYGGNPIEIPGFDPLNPDAQIKVD